MLGNLGGGRLQELQPVEGLHPFPWLQKTVGLHLEDFGNLFYDGQGRNALAALYHVDVVDVFIEQRGKLFLGELCPASVKF